MKQRKAGKERRLLLIACLLDMLFSPSPWDFGGLVACAVEQHMPYLPETPFCMSATFTLTAVLLAWRLELTQDELAVGDTGDDSHVQAGAAHKHHAGMSAQQVAEEE